MLSSHDGTLATCESIIAGQNSDLKFSGFYRLPLLSSKHSSSCSSIKLASSLFLDSTWMLLIQQFSSYCLPCKKSSHFPFFPPTHLAYVLLLFVTQLKPYFLLWELLKLHVTSLPVHFCLYCTASSFIYAILPRFKHFKTCFQFLL